MTPPVYRLPVRGVRMMTGAEVEAMFTDPVPLTPPAAPDAPDAPVRRVDAAVVVVWGVVLGIVGLGAAVAAGLTP